MNSKIGADRDSAKSITYFLKFNRKLRSLLFLMFLMLILYLIPLFIIVNCSI